MVLMPRKIQLHTLFSLILFVTILFGTSESAPVEAQEPAGITDLRVEEIFETLTPEERVGQLFMVSFNGADTSANSAIAELIQKYRIGGVVLSAANRNFTNNDTTPTQVLNLTNALQRLAGAPPVSSLANQDDGATTTPLTGTTSATNTVDIYNPMPLFIAVAHEGDGYPYTQIRGGLTDVPNAMALGATWKPENARLVGQVVGQELSMLGVNMLFGPSLDVLDNPRSDRSGSLGTRTFGGHPFWVGEMGQAYIRGVHEGSNAQILTIAEHFPGFGSSDRAINQGVPTITKPLEELRRTELAPFFKVTFLDPENPGDLQGITDGLMTAHARYQGLQGNVPISLDARNLPALLALKEIALWREAGGLVVSAPLGVPAALEGIAAGRENFPARRLAQDALVAGSDVLQLVDFAFEKDPEAELTNIKNAIEFFRERYASEPNFQTAVDRAVYRIIKAKLKIYGEDLFAAETQKPRENLALLDQITIDIDQIAQAGATLITPISGLTNPLPGPPAPGDSILIFTDDRMGQDCPSCSPFPLIQTNELEKIILELFGPDATGQILPEQIASYSFSELKTVAEPTEGKSIPDNIQAIEAQIEAADWIIFAMLDINPEEYPESDAVRSLLRNRYDTLRNKNLVLFAFNAPYFLGETEISQLTAYYGFYDKSHNYLETAARLLFQQFEPSGASPVAIPAIGNFDLSPDPNQVIQLDPVQKIDTNGNMVPLEDQRTTISTLDLKVGEGVRFQTSVIMDRNGHPVPDGTTVDFWRFYPLENLSLEPLTVRTQDGIAAISIFKERDTPLQIRASSNLASQSETFNIGPGIVDTPTPTPTSTATPTETPTATSSPTPSPTAPPPTETPTEAPIPLATQQPLTGLDSASTRPINVVDLAYSLLGMIVIGGIAFTLGGDRFSLEERVRPALVAIALGLVGYIIYAIIVMISPRFGFLSQIVELGTTGHWVAPLVSLLFAIMGTIAWFLKPGRIFWVKDESEWSVEVATEEK